MKKFPWRSILYAVILLYLLIDLQWCRGPIKRSIDKRRTGLVSEAVEKKWVAIINREPIPSAQLDLAVIRHLYQRGKTPEEVPEKNLKMIRRAVLQTLINDTLVRQYADGEKFTAPQDEIDAFIEKWESQFGSEEELAERSELQGLSKEQRDKQLARIWSRKRWLERRIDPGVAVTSEEARSWYDFHKEKGEGFREPEKIRARHVFISTVEVDDETREKLITDAYEQISSGEKSFEEVASEISDDPRSKNRGGDLNWFSRDRVSEEFSEIVFGLEDGVISKPFRTEIGWHIAEVTDRQPARDVTFEEMADEISALLRNDRREDTIKLLMKKLRTVAKIQLFPENI